MKTFPEKLQRYRSIKVHMALSKPHCMSFLFFFFEWSLHVFSYASTSSTYLILIQQNRCKNVSKLEVHVEKKDESVAQSEGEKKDKSVAQSEGAHFCKHGVAGPSHVTNIKIRADRERKCRLKGQIFKQEWPIKTKCFNKQVKTFFPKKRGRSQTS